VGRALGRERAPARAASCSGSRCGGGRALRRSPPRPHPGHGPASSRIRSARAGVRGQWLATIGRRRADRPLPPPSPRSPVTIKHLRPAAGLWYEQIDLPEEEPSNSSRRFLPQPNRYRPRRDVRIQRPNDRGETAYSSALTCFGQPSAEPVGIRCMDCAWRAGDRCARCAPTIPATFAPDTRRRVHRRCSSSMSHATV